MRKLKHREVNSPLMVKVSGGAEDSKMYFYLLYYDTTIAPIMGGIGSPQFFINTHNKWSSEVCIVSE